MICFLLGCLLTGGVADAQELLWFRTAPFQLEPPVSDIVSAVHGVDGGVLAGGHVQKEYKLGGHFLQLVGSDGEEIWRCEIPPGSFADLNPIYVDAPLIASHPDGGWWFVVRYRESANPRRTATLVRYHISSDGSILGSHQAPGTGTLITSDGTIIEDLNNYPSLYYDEKPAWAFRDVESGTLDSLVFDLKSIFSSFSPRVIIPWWHTLEDRAYILITNPLVGECALVSLNFTTGGVQVVRLDEFPTRGLSGLVTRDGSVVILGRETRWREGTGHDMVLIRPGADGGEAERIRLPISSTYENELIGELSTGEILFQTGHYTDGKWLIRVSDNGSKIEELRLFDAAGFDMSLSPDDALYVKQGGVGRIIDPEPTSSVSEDRARVNPWRELDLSHAE